MDEQTKEIKEMKAMIDVINGEEHMDEQVVVTNVGAVSTQESSMKEASTHAVVRNEEAEKTMTEEEKFWEKFSHYNREDDIVTVDDVIRAEAAIPKLKKLIDGLDTYDYGDFDSAWGDLLESCDNVAAWTQIMNEQYDAMQRGDEEPHYALGLSNFSIVTKWCVDAYVAFITDERAVHWDEEPDILGYTIDQLVQSRQVFVDYPNLSEKVDAAYDEWYEARKQFEREERGWWEEDEEEDSKGDSHEDENNNEELDYED